MAELTGEQLKQLYQPSAREPVVVRVPRMNFLTIDGEGRPDESAAFQEAVGALYGVCYTMKFMHQPGQVLRDTRVLPLEGRWWTKSGSLGFDQTEELLWTMMIAQPRAATKRTVQAAIAELRRRKNPAGLERMRFEPLTEGLCVQVMHVGPYSAEKPTVDRLRAFAEEKGLRLSGLHHEVYLSDPHRTRPAKLRTVLRYPVSRGR